jgi:hypothetical protein
MSISFQTPKSSLDLNNALASRLLSAMGLPLTNAGECTIEQAKAGIALALPIVSEDDRVYLRLLEGAVKENEEADQNLAWF